MNPYVIIGVLVAWVASLAGVGYVAFDYGESRTIAQQKKTDDVVRAVAEAAQRSAADAISKIKPRNTTIQQEVRREIETNTVYRDCRVTPDGVRLANEGLTGKPQPADGGKLPGTGAADAKP